MVHFVCLSSSTVPNSFPLILLGFYSRFINRSILGFSWVFHLQIQDLKQKQETRRKIVGFVAGSFRSCSCCSCCWWIWSRILKGFSFLFCFVCWCRETNKKNGKRPTKFLYDIRNGFSFSDLINTKRTHLLLVLSFSSVFELRKVFSSSVSGSSFEGKKGIKAKCWQWVLRVFVQPLLAILYFGNFR